MRRWAWVSFGLCVLATGCVRTLPGQDPPASARFYYPNRMALSADQNSLFVVSTNFDERYNVGWVTRVNLGTLLPTLAAAQAANQVVDAAQVAGSMTQSLRVASLAGDFVVDAAHNRAYLAHRGQGLITTFDLSAESDGATRIDCGDITQPDATEGLTNMEKQTSCDRAHLFDLGRAGAAAAAALAAPQNAYFDEQTWRDPFALALVPAAQGSDYPVLMTGFLGASSLVALQSAANPQDLQLVRTTTLSNATLSALIPIPSAPATQGGGTLLGTTHLDPPRIGRDALFNTARSALFAVDVPALLANPAQAPAAVVRYDLNLALGADGSGADITGAAFSTKDPSRLFVAHHNPDAVLLLERYNQPISSFDANGVLNHAAQVQTSVQDSALLGDGRLSRVAYIERQAGDLLAVLSLAGDMLYLFDVRYDTLILVGRFAFRPGQGPVDIAHVADEAHDYLFVTTFFDHGLTVLDVSSANLGDIRLAASIQDTTRLTPDAQP